jgi:hypothetical protein
MAEIIAKTKIRSVAFRAENSIQSRTVVNGLMICATKKSICKFRDIRKTAGSRRGPTGSGTVSIGTTTADDTRVIRNGTIKKFIFYYEKWISRSSQKKVLETNISILCGKRSQIVTSIQMRSESTR